MISLDARVAAGVEFVMLVAAVTLLAAWFVVVRGSTAGGLVAATLALASPVVVYAGTTAFVDVWAMAFLAAAVIVGLHSLGDVVASKAWAWAVVGALIGSAAATKYTGIVFGGAVAAGLLVANSRSWRAWRWVSIVVMAFLVLAVPWYAWTVRVSGDPLYPFATGLFGNRAGLWTAQEIQYQEVVARAFVGPGPLAVALRDLDYFRGARAT